MRVLLVTDHYLPRLGGIETHVAGLAERLVGRGHDVTVLTVTPAATDGRRHDDRSGPVRVQRSATLLEAARGDLAAFDVVHSHLSVVSPFAAPLASVAARQGVPTVATVHSLWDGMGPVPTAAAALAGLRRSDVLWTAVSTVAADQVSRRLPGSPEVLVLPNAVDVAPRPSTPVREPGAPVRLVSTMRLARRKRPLPLLAMAERLRETCPVPFELTIVGDGALRGRVERQVRRRGLTDVVRLTGRVEADEVAPLLARSDVYVAPAVLESFGLAALEARTTGLPVVGRAGSGMSDFLRHGRDGWLCDSDAAMVATLHALVTDDVLRVAVSEHNRAVPPGTGWTDTLDRHEDAYARARAGGGVPWPPVPSPRRSRRDGTPLRG